jgi:hypothetical protein
MVMMIMNTVGSVKSSGDQCRLVYELGCGLVGYRMDVKLGRACLAAHKNLREWTLSRYAMDI